MPFIPAIHEWIISHPVAFPLILAFGVGVPVSIFSGELRQFVLLPPQRIGIWILKARIAAAKSKAVQLKRMAESMQFTLSELFWALFQMLLSLLLFAVLILGRIDGLADPRHASMILYRLLRGAILIGTYFSMFYMARIIKMTKLSSRVDSQLNHLAHDIEVLESRLKSVLSKVKA